MSSLEAVELTAVLQQPQQPVAGIEFGRVGASHVPVGGQFGQGAESRTHMQALVTAPVDELEELDGELDVPQSARTELDTTILLADAPRLVLDAPAHGSSVVHEILPATGLPDEGVHGPCVGGAEFGVAGAGPRLEQRLELP